MTLTSNHQFALAMTTLGTSTGNSCDINTITPVKARCSRRAKAAWEQSTYLAAITGQRCAMALARLRKLQEDLLLGRHERVAVCGLDVEAACAEFAVLAG